MTTEKATLFLLPTAFEDAALPGQTFLCREGTLVEGVLSSRPALLEFIEIQRVNFPRPRTPVIAMVGEANQSLPVLVLPLGETSSSTTGEANGRQFASGADAILATLAERHKIPAIHP